jgi:hypothetical protein
VAVGADWPAHAATSASTTAISTQAAIRLAFPMAVSTAGF